MTKRYMRRSIQGHFQRYKIQCFCLLQGSGMLVKLLNACVFDISPVVFHLFSVWLRVLRPQKVLSRGLLSYILPIHPRRKRTSPVTVLFHEDEDLFFFSFASPWQRRICPVDWQQSAAEANDKLIGFDFGGVRNGT